MKRSSSDTSQMALDWSRPLEERDAHRDAPGSARDQAANLPRVVFGGQAVADAARRAGRLNAASISQQEHEALLAERQALLDKQFAGSISRRELNRLEYVRWSLDRIEDARHGHVLDALEDAVSRYEGFLEEMAQLREQIERATGTKK